MEVVEVKFEYDAEQPDELTLHVGDIIKNCRLVEDGWMEGELNGKRGIFPDNFVVRKEITPPPPPAQTVEHVPMRSKTSSKQRKAKARFSYHPQAEDELELADGDEVLVLEVVEEGWWKGRVGHKEGVFPSNFVEDITEDASEPSSSSHNDKPVPAPHSETVDHIPAPNRASGIMMPAMKGLDPANLRANLRKTDPAKKPPPPNTSPKVPNKPPVTHAPPPPVTNAAAAAAAAAKKTAKVMFDYEATQVDELTIKVDDIVEVVSDEEPGWIKVKLGDKMGIIPDNFIEIIKKEPPKLPTPPLPSREEPPPVGRPPPPEKKEEPVKRPPIGVPLPGASSLQRHPPPVAVKKPVSKPPPVAGPRPTKPAPAVTAHNTPHDSAVINKPPPPVTSRTDKSKTQDDKERSLDLDTVPKTEKLDTQVVSTRPKMPHNPPSRSHIHQGNEDKEPKEDDSDMPPWKRELQKKRREPKPQPVPPSKPVQPSVQPSEPPPPTAIKPEVPVNVPPVSTSTTAPVSTGVSEGVVKQLKEELDLLKKEIESLKPLKKELELLKLDYKKDVEILTQDLDEERKKVAGLQVEIDRLKKSKGFR